MLPRRKLKKFYAAKASSVIADKAFGKPKWMNKFHKAVMVASELVLGPGIISSHFFLAATTILVKSLIGSMLIKINIFCT